MDGEQDSSKVSQALQEGQQPSHLTVLYVHEEQMKVCVTLAINRENFIYEGMRQFLSTLYDGILMNKKG